VPLPRDVKKPMHSVKQLTVHVDSKAVVDLAKSTLETRLHSPLDIKMLTRQSSVAAKLWVSILRGE
jgi:hypothetical protein